MSQLLSGLMGGGGGLSASSSASSSGHQTANTGVQVNQPINFGTISGGGYGGSAVESFIDPFAGGGWSSPVPGASNATAGGLGTASTSSSMTPYIILGLIAVVAVVFLMTQK